MQSYFKVVALLTTQDSSLSFYYQMAGVSFKTLLGVVGCGSSIIALATVSLYGLALAYMYQKRSIDEKCALGLAALLTILVDYHQHYDFVVLLLLFPVFFFENRVKHPGLFFYYAFLLYLPNISRFNFFGISTAAFFQDNILALVVWQIFYTGMYLLLTALYIKEFVVPASIALRNKQG
jgi:hypothetical protein